MNKHAIKKRIRLKNFTYVGQYRYFVTMCTDKTVGQCFSIANKQVIEKLVEILKLISLQYNFKVWAYCFMPDHLHLLVEGEEPTSDFKKFISLFKQVSGFYYSKTFGKRLWQINYYEHILRKEEVTESIARYILENPIRKRLVEDFKEYPFLGSFVFDIKTL
jgi:putative transposase